jgi:peroxiredoxin
MKINATLTRNLFLSVLLSCATTFVPWLPYQAAENAPAASQAEVGKKAPDFTLSDIDGKSATLSKFHGKFVVLEWFNDGCPFVKKHYNSNNMQALQKDYAKKGVVWLSICSSAPGKQGNHTNAEFKKILKDWKAEPAHLLIDTEGTVGHLYGARTTPDMFVISKDGTVIYAGAIDDQPVPDADSVKNARNYVREALDQTLAGKEISTKSTKSYGCSVKYKG